MDAELRISHSDPIGEMASLTAWLRSQRDLQGRVRPQARPPGPQELGGAVELLSVALGSGGAGLALARALTTWLTNRHSDVSVTVTTETGSVTVDAKRIGDVLPLLHEVLKPGTDGNERT
ncbi:effector-associated constant component EACC1 [Nonomuraea jabiensis]|uniref:Uncharacterized protein n=1 Tax=Nonomuraea jabiensis TaxID=882448 RepID=A0A7W9LCH0_9ACTN|nr:hypothetical protein [Nonomuraea jabiensis]MBB5778720.1 hypothetical protein [Nonomuraea jabiensis]